MYEQRHAFSAAASQLAIHVEPRAQWQGYIHKPRFLKRVLKRWLLFVVLCMVMIGAYFKWDHTIELLLGFDVERHSELAPTQPNTEPLAVVLEREVRVLCWIMTTPKYHRSKADYVLRTWGKRCNRLLFITSQPDDVLETVIVKAEDEYDVIWGKTKEAFQYMYDHYRDEADWFMKADDDTYVFMENLRYLLYPYPPEMPIYFGCNFKLPGTEFTYMSGGSGYVLSKEALRRFVTIALKNPNKCRQENDHPEDIEIGRCLANVGVMAGDSRDSEKKLRFLPFQPYDGLMGNRYEQDFWYFEYMVYNPRMCQDCLSGYPASFHYIDAETMLAFEFLTNELNVAELEVIEDTELPARIDVENYKVPEPDNIILKNHSV